MAGTKSSVLLGLLSALSVCFQTELVIAAARSMNPEVMSYWDQSMAGTVMPDAMQGLVSPLSTARAQLFRSTIEGGHIDAEPRKAAAFCAASDLMCRGLDELAGIPDQGMQFQAVKNFSPTAHESLEAQQFTWFLESALSDPSYSLPASMPEIADSHKAFHRAFLPRDLVQALGPPSRDNVPGLLAKLHIPADSVMAHGMRETGMACDTSNMDRMMGEMASCVSSVEQMSDLLCSHFSDGFMMLEMGSVPLAATASFKVGEVKLMADEGHSYLAAHPTLFPYNVLLAHHMAHTKVYAVTLLSSEYSIASVAQCHMDTREWSPLHAAFKLLGTKPGDSAVCHWMHSQGMVFVPAMPPLH